MYENKLEEKPLDDSSLEDAMRRLMGLPIYTPTERELIEEANGLSRELRDRYNGDAQKLSTLLQMVADIATRVAWQDLAALPEGTPKSDLYGWIDARNEMIDKGRTSARRRDPGIPYVGAYTPTVKERESRSEVKISDMSREDVAAFVKEPIEKLHGFASGGITAYAEAFAAAAYAGREGELARHHARVHSDDPSELSRIEERIQWAREAGEEIGRNESAECESHAASEVATGAQGQG